MENRVQVENRFPSVKMFITIHQPKSFLSPLTLDPNESMPAPRRNVLLRHHAAPGLPFNVGHLYMGLYRCYKGIFKTGVEVLSIVLHTSSNTRSCLECRLKGKTLLLPPHKKREDAHILCDARFKSQLT